MSTEPSREHVEAVANGGYERRSCYADCPKCGPDCWCDCLECSARALLTSTDPAVLDAMQDALVRAGRLTTETGRAPAFIGLSIDYGSVEMRRFVTEWQEAQP